MTKTILITGATSGIGKSTAYTFAKNGYNLILTGRRLERLQALEKEINSLYSVQVLTLCFDVRNEIDTQKALQTIDLSVFKSIDILVNNAGLASGSNTIDNGNMEDWNKMIDTNIKGLLHVSKEIIPIFKQQGYGHIINIGSTAGKDAYLNGNVYCATKFAVDALNKSMRIDLLPYGIKVTAINPGACETEFSEVRFHGDKEKADAVYKGFTPLKPDDIAQTIYYTATLPAHVCINDLTITCLDQANANYIHKK
ncbi:MAG: SDR family NAD(P)-dependent oxidoreductase [Chitinophagaceae bacterium]